MLSSLFVRMQETEWLIVVNKKSKARRAWYRIYPDDCLYCVEAIGSNKLALDMGAFAHMDFRCGCGHSLLDYPNHRQN